MLAESPEHYPVEEGDEEGMLPSFLPLSHEADQEHQLVEHIAEEIVESVPDFSFLFRSKGTLRELLLRTIKDLPPTQLRTSLLQNLPRHVISVENR